MAKKKAKIAHAEIVRLFGERLRELRHSRGMTQLQLARKAHVNVVYIGRLEGGGAAPGIDLVDRLAKALGASATDLMPAMPTPDTLAVLQDQAKSLFDEILQADDRESLLTLCPLLRLIAERIK
jgi:transcriptional regulator with XRE-family HTH domain